MAGMFSQNILIRVEPELRDTLNAVARAEKTTASELARRELRSALASRRSRPAHSPSVSVQ